VLSSMMVLTIGFLLSTWIDKAGNCGRPYPR
jgi:hypothetical protein